MPSEDVFYCKVGFFKHSAVEKVHVTRDSEKLRYLPMRGWRMGKVHA